MEKLHPDEKCQLGARFPQLDAILKQRQEIQQQIRELMSQAEELRRRDHELDERFHREALAVIPTVSKKLPTGRRPSGPDQNQTMVANLLKALEQKGPNVEEQLRQILDKFGIKK